VQIWTCYIKALKNYHLTDVHTYRIHQIIYHAALRVGQISSKVKSQGQISLKSISVLGFIITDIHTKLRQFLIIHTYTHKQTINIGFTQCSWRTETNNEEVVPSVGRSRPRAMQHDSELSSHKCFRACCILLYHTPPSSSPPPSSPPPHHHHHHQPITSLLSQWHMLQKPAPDIGAGFWSVCHTVWHASGIKFLPAPVSGVKQKLLYFCTRNQQERPSVIGWRISLHSVLPLFGIFESEDRLAI